MLTDKVLPVLHLKWKNGFVTLDKELELCDITDSIEDFVDMPIVVLSGEEFSSFSHVYDLRFFRFLIHSLKREPEYKNAIESIGALLEKQDEPSSSADMKSRLLAILHISHQPKVLDFLDRKMGYYQTVGRPTLSNVKHFNVQKIQLDYHEYIADKKDVEQQFVSMSNNKYYLNLEADCFNAETGRLNSKLYSKLQLYRPFFIPEHDKIVEFDAIAAEWRFLLELCDESDKDVKEKGSYWDNLATIIGVHSQFTGKQLKSMVYPMLYGGGMEAITKASNLSVEQVKVLQHHLRHRFEKTFAFLRSENNKYYSKDSNVIYDYYGKEMTVSSNYVKANYLLQSSLATHFQLFVYNMRQKLTAKGMQTNILFTVHDSMLVDFKNAEKSDFLTILQSTLKAMKPPLFLTVKQ